MSLDLVLDRILGVVPILGPWYRTTEGKKKIRYALVSVVAVPVGTAAVAAFDIVGFSAGWAAVCGNSLGSIPSYILNRYWVWAKTDKNSLMTEILPFWAITLVGIVFSLLVGHEAGQFTRHHGIGGAGRIAILLAANLFGFGILWVVKYVVFNRILFVTKDRPASEVR